MNPDKIFHHKRKDKIGNLEVEGRRKNNVASGGVNAQHTLCLSKDKKSYLIIGAEIMTTDIQVNFVLRKKSKVI